MLEQRIKNLAASLPEDFEAAIIKTQSNRFYLLDYDSDSAGTLVMLPGKMFFIIDSRYEEKARNVVKNAEVVLETDALSQAGEILRQHGVKKLLVENQISVESCENMVSAFKGMEVDSSPVLSRALKACRAIKDEEEISRMKKAQDIADACFTHILPFIKEDVREIDIMLEIEHYMRSNGAEKVSFDTISLTGPSTSLPHGVPGENRVKPGDFITMDFGALYKGYCSDMTRTVAFGEPGEEKRKVYETVLKAHLAGIEAARAGARCNDVDKIARDIINDAGYKGLFGHGLGHSVGIDVHEDPRLSPKCGDILKQGMIMTVEPGCYIPGRFGCRIEDMVLITSGGCKPFPSSEKQLIVL